MIGRSNSAPLVTNTLPRSSIGWNVSNYLASSSVRHTLTLTSGFAA
jgi:hypothetical protein